VKSLKEYIFLAFVVALNDKIQDLGLVLIMLLGNTAESGL